MSTITKVTVRNFVEAVEYKALRSIAKKYDEQVKAEKERIMLESGVRANLKLMQDKLSEIDKVYDEVESVCNACAELKYNNQCYASIGRALNINFEASFNECTTFNSKKIVELAQEYDIKKDNVKNEYAKVLASIKRMGSVNKMIKYLKDLGFDTTSIEKEQTAITTNVDTKYLFVCGDNK
ncbi:hypothetical protein [Anaerosporobacter sp.]